jgi:hypothetical protein
MERDMPRVLVVGYDPDSVDFTDPAAPRGINAEKIRAGVALGMREMRDRGWEADHCDIRPDANAVPAVERQLASATYDVVVIGAGVRLSSRHPEVFYAVINVVHKGAPGANIAFNATQDDIPEAAARRLPSYSDGFHLDQSNARSVPGSSTDILRGPRCVLIPCRLNRPMQHRR